VVPYCCFILQLACDAGESRPSHLLPPRLTFPQKTKLVKLVDHIGLLPTYNDIPCLTRNIECLAAAEKDCLSFSSENFINFAPVPSPECRDSGDVSFKIPIAEPSTLFYDKADETKIKVYGSFSDSKV
jgi:hypothetical protein